MRRVLAWIGRLLAAAVCLGLVGAVVVATPWRPAAPTPAAPVRVAVPAAPTDLVCPGPARLPTEPSGDAQGADGSGTTYDPQFAPAPKGSSASLTALTLPRASAAPAPAVVRGLADPGDEQASLAGSVGAGVRRLGQPDAALVLHADAADGGSARLSGSLVARTDAGDLRGLVAAACRPAGNDAWLIGSSTATGSSARLVLQNPGSTAASVDLEVWGASGRVDLVGSGALLVPPGGERAVMLEGLAALEPRIVVHVSAAGGAVAAYLQDSALDGLTPRGVDDVVPGAAPALHLLLAGVSVADGAAGADPGAVRLLAPDEAGTVDVRALGPAGEMTLAEDLDLAAGEVVDVPLTGVPAGTWAVEVESTTPVVAGAMIARTGAQGSLGAPVDRAWVPARALPAADADAGTPSAVAGGVVALPAGVTWQVALAAGGGPGAVPASATVQVVGSDGVVLHERDVTVAPGAVLTLDAAGLGLGAAEDVAGVVVLPGDGSVVWGVVLTVAAPDGDLVAWLGPVPGASDEESVRVRLD
jgi:hypothetical protein